MGCAHRFSSGGRLGKSSPSDFCFLHLIAYRRGVMGHFCFLASRGVSWRRWSSHVVSWRLLPFLCTTVVYVIYFAARKAITAAGFRVGRVSRASGRERKRESEQESER